MSGALVAQAINESVGTPGFQGLDAILKEYLGLIAEQAGTARVPISRTINGHSLASDVDLDNNDVGAAPAGFGLGTTAYTTIVTMDELNATTRNGWYQVYLPGSVLNNVYFNTAFLHVMNYEVGKHCVQELYPIGTTTPLVRKMQDGVWDAWESVNPPLIAGFEYRTTERWQGKPVYVKVTNIGSLPASGYVDVNVLEAVNALDTIVNIEWHFESESTLKFYTTPVQDLTISPISCATTYAWARFAVSSDLSHISCKAIVRYTKA